MEPLGFCEFALMGVTPISLTAIANGFKCLFECPATPTIPVYLIGGGILGLLTLPFDANWRRLGNFLLYLAFAVTGFFWLHYGGELNHEDPQARNYCSKRIYEHAVFFNHFSLFILFSSPVLHVIQLCWSSCRADDGDTN